MFITSEMYDKDARDLALVELQAIARIESRFCPDAEQWYLEYFDRNGRLLGRVEQASLEDCDRFLGRQQIFPAAPGFSVLVPIQETIEVVAIPIIGWRTAGIHGFDVITADAHVFDFAVIEWPDGRVFDGDSIFPNRAEYLMCLADVADDERRHRGGRVTVH